jgi:hypothetical protein
MNHTKGEWIAKDGQIYPQETGKTLALIPYFELGNEEHEANQKLIAAAPDLLEACEWAVKQFKRLADEGRYPEFMLANNGGNGIMNLVNAINKAKGVNQ